MQFVMVTDDFFPCFAYASKRNQMVNKDNQDLSPNKHLNAQMEVKI